MATEIISPEDFIAKVSNRLPDHYAYKQTWRIYLYPEGANGATATRYEIEPREDIGHIKQVIDEVKSSYAIDPKISLVDRS